MQSDSSVAFSAALRMASNRPLNVLAAEVSLLLEDRTVELLVGEHIAGTLNHVADALSRLAEGGSIPELLSKAVSRTAPTRRVDFYRPWPPDW